MFTDKEKALAIAQIKYNVPLEEISSSTGIPLTLLKEWSSKFGEADLVQIESNVHAIQHYVKGDVMDIGLLENRLGYLALTIANEVDRVVGTDDVITAKALNLSADTICKLFETFIRKNSAAQPVKPDEDSFFAKILKD